MSVISRESSPSSSRAHQITRLEYYIQNGHSYIDISLQETIKVFTTLNSALSYTVGIYHPNQQGCATNEQQHLHLTRMDIDLIQKQ